MRTILQAAHIGRTAPIRVVMLPGAYSRPEDFVREGFVEAVRARALAVDLVFAAPELPQVVDRSVLDSLHEDIVRPAQRAGCAVWVGGVSLGGYIALSYAARHARELAGVCVLAPYLGSHIITGEIERAGGVHRWSPGELADDEDERHLWRFIRTHGAAPLSMHLGLGRDDRFAARQRLMAAALAPEAVDTVPGGHDWPTWRTLWERFLDARLTPHPTHGGWRRGRPGL